jgi:peptidoglycan hydrolase CwlO-like protein
MSTETPSPPGLLRRLWQAFVTLVKIAFVVAVLAGIGWAGWYVYQQVTHSFNNLEQRDALVQQRLDLVRSDIDGLMENRTTQGTQLTEIKGDVTALDDELAALTAELAADLAHQEELLAKLENNIGGLVASTGVITQNIDTLNAGIVALQGDVNENSASVDQLGGNFDQLDTNVTDLDQNFGSLETMVMDEMAANSEAVTEMAQALMLFRTWEMVYRARLRLLEQNIGLAMTDVAVAQGTLATLIENSDGASAATLAVVQQRLDLVAASLPQDPEMAARDLESAWVALDNILSALLGVPEIVLPETAVITPTPPPITATTPITP